MPSRIVTPAEHYDQMAAEMADPARPDVVDPVDDPSKQRAWMDQTEGPAFLAALGDVRGQAVLEIGVGTGRVARKLLDLGCASFTGLDISAATLERTRRNLAGYANVELVLADAADFVRPEAFDAIVSVWTFFHIEDQARALANAVASLKPGGRLVLSLERVDAWLDYGPRKLRLHPADPAACAARLRALGCQVDEPVPVPDTLGDGQPLTTVLRAERPA